MSMRHCRDCGTAWESGESWYDDYLTDCPRCELGGAQADLRGVLEALHGLLEIRMWSESGQEWQRQIAEIYDRYSDEPKLTERLEG